METYADFAFALKIKETGNATLSRQYYNFMVSELNVDLERVVDWSGFRYQKYRQAVTSQPVC